VRGHAVAGRYARALFDVVLRTARDEGIDPDDLLRETQRQLAALAAAAAGNAGLAALLRSPVVTGAEKCRVLSEIMRLSLPDAAEPHMIVTNFCGLLAGKGRLPLLELIVQALAERLDARQGIVLGRLHTAVSLDGARREAVRTRLENALGGRRLVLEYLVDPSILGGMTIRLGNRVLDASLRKQIDTLRDTIKKGE
jgi:F-type H+-transporting ATPase subunit delta